MIIVTPKNAKLVEHARDALRVGPIPHQAALIHYPGLIHLMLTGEARLDGENIVATQETWPSRRS